MISNRQRRKRQTAIAVWISGVFLVIVAGLAVVGPIIAPIDPLKQNLSTALQSPGTSSMLGMHLLGTDELGRDTFSRLIAGARPIVIIAIVSTALAMIFGSLIGLVAGSSNRWPSNVLMRLADIQLSIPPIILAIVLAVAITPGVISATAAIALVTWPQYARVVRAEAARLRSSDFVKLARVAGLRSARLLGYHIAPNVVGVVVVLATLNLSVAVLYAASLSFLGVGVQQPTPDWGNMIAGGTQYLQQWWLVAFPGAAITLTVLSLNIMGDHLRDRLDPRLRKRGRADLSETTEAVVA